MDYETFTKKFPSDAFLAKHLISKAAFKRRFMATFFVRGFLGVGMSDVGLSQLYESGAVVHVFGRPLIIPWKFDVTSRYQREVRYMTHGILDVISTLVRRMQDGIYPHAKLIIREDGSISVGEETVTLDAISEGTQTPPEALKALIVDMKDVIATEAFEWKGIGVFTVTDNAIVCIPEPERPDRGIAKLPGNWTPAKSVRDRIKL